METEIYVLNRQRAEKQRGNNSVTVNCLNMTTQRNLTTPLRYTAPQIKAVPSSSADTPRRKAAVKAD